MKLHSPTGCSAASHAGSAIVIDEDGYVEVDADAACALLAHGFKLLNETHIAMSTEKQGIDLTGLKRGDLFAILKAEGISVTLPVTNEELRALIRQSEENITRGPSPNIPVKGS